MIPEAEDGEWEKVYEQFFFLRLNKLNTNFKNKLFRICSKVAKIEFITRTQFVIFGQQSDYFMNHFDVPKYQQRAE